MTSHITLAERASGPCPWDCKNSFHASPSIPERSAHPAVLISSDDSELCSSIQVVLTTAGIETRVAGLHEALASLESQKPNLVLLDLPPEGLEASSLCRDMHADCLGWRSPVILISAPGNLPAKVRALECGAVDYLSKPLNMLEIVARVKTHLCLQRALERVVELHSEKLQLLAGAQQFCMPRPQDLPAANFAVAIRQVHRAGGDFYDVVDLGSSQCDYIVADASGHDLAATYWTLALKTLFVEYSGLLLPPLDTLYMINRTLLRILPVEVFFTAIYVRLNRDSGQLFLLSAGHPPVIYLPHESGEPRLIRQASDLLGAFPDARFSQLELSVSRGDRLFLFSDGLVDASGHHERGLDRLKSVLMNSRDVELSVAVQGALAQQFYDCEPSDDALLLGIEV